jgi:hypothetical protein
LMERCCEKAHQDMLKRKAAAWELDKDREELMEKMRAKAWKRMVTAWCPVKDSEELMEGRW